jgi:hypothetical protein
VLLLLRLPSCLLTQASDGTCWPHSTRSCFDCQGLVVLLKPAALHEFGYSKLLRQLLNE